MTSHLLGRVVVAVMLVVVGAACSNPVDQGRPFVRYAVAPAVLDVAVNQTVALKIAALSPQGDTVLIGTVVELGFTGTAQLSTLGCHVVGETCQITALGSGTGTITLVLGNYGRCLDGPDCMAREWQTDTVITVPTTVR